MKLKKPPAAFLGSRFSSSARDFDMALFGAPHGTPYRGIDNRPYERAPNVLRKALKADQAFIDSWDFDFGGPLLGKSHKFRVADLGDLPTQPKQAARNRKMIEDCTRAVIANGAVPIMIGGDDSTPIPRSPSCRSTPISTGARSAMTSPSAFRAPCAAHPR